MGTLPKQRDVVADAKFIFNARGEQADAMNTKIGIDNDSETLNDTSLRLITFKTDDTAEPAVDTRRRALGLCGDSVDIG